MRTVTGPEHYREAERLLAQEYETWEERAAIAAAAQVHATLALAAATALGAGQVEDPGMLPDDMHAWQELAGTPSGERVVSRPKRGERR